MRHNLAKAAECDFIKIKEFTFEEPATRSVNNPIFMIIFDYVH